MEKFTDRTERFAVQSMVTPEEKTSYEDALSDLNKERRAEGKEKVKSAELFRSVAVSFTKNPKKMLEFIKFQ